MKLLNTLVTGLLLNVLKLCRDICLLLLQKLVLIVLPVVKILKIYPGGAPYSVFSCQFFSFL